MFILFVYKKTFLITVVNKSTYQIPACFVLYTGKFLYLALENTISDLFYSQTYRCLFAISRHRMRVLLLCLVVGWSLEEAMERDPRGIYGNRIDIQAGFFPAGTPGPVLVTPGSVQVTPGPLPVTPGSINVHPGPALVHPVPPHIHPIHVHPVHTHGACPPTVIYNTHVKYSTIVFPSVTTVGGAQTQTQTATSTQLITSTIFSNVGSNQVTTQIVFQTRTVTTTQGGFGTQFVTVPGPITFVTRTEEVLSTLTQGQTVFVTETRQVSTTFTITTYSNIVIPQPVFSTIFVTNTQTRTETLPGQTQTIQSTVYSTTVSTVFLPGQDVTSTRTIFSTSLVTQTITQGGQTLIITSTQFVPVTSTIFSTTAITNTQTRFVTSTLFTNGVTTVVSVQQVPVFNTRTVTAAGEITSTIVSTQGIGSTATIDTTIDTTVTLSGGTSVVTATSTALKTQLVPGAVRTVYRTHVVYHTNLITSTVLNRYYKTLTATRTLPVKCKTGYGHPSPTPAHKPWGR